MNSFILARNIIQFQQPPPQTRCQQSNATTKQTAYVSLTLHCGWIRQQVEQSSTSRPSPTETKTKIHYWQERCHPIDVRRFRHVLLRESPSARLTIFAPCLYRSYENKHTLRSKNSTHKEDDKTHCTHPIRQRKTFAHVQNHSPRDRATQSCLQAAAGRGGWREGR